MVSTTTKTDRHYTRTTPQETKWLDDLKVRNDFSSRSDAIRYCIQRTIEEESDAIGSRRHFTRTMNARLDEVIAVTTLYGAMLNVTFTESFTALINLLNEAEEGERLDADTLRSDLYPKILKQASKVMLAMQAVQRKLDEQQKKARRTQKPPPPDNA
jgi:Arc/MetJ-type ribon-helix-helix transcriptional regulator